MKTKNFTLYVTILMMGAVLTAAGQPARGERDGSHDNNNRKELKSATRNETRGNRNIHYNTQKNDKVRPQEQMRVTEDKAVRRETGTSGHQATNMGNSKSGAGHDGYTNKRNDRGDNRGYANNRGYRENPAPDNHRDNRNMWDNRNYNRHEWEHRNYNWDDHHWNFSNYYRKGYIPYYFRNNRNYWYYPQYGHILRGFDHNPFLFYSGRIPFFLEDGFFYRYYNGIGYVWVEDPYNLWFNELPYEAVRVRIGGEIYFRLGNVYFEPGPRGFRAVMLPDRYYDPDYHRGVSIGVSARF